ncbi:MAG: hypothetical protein QM594_11835 [Niabella sp.]
MKSNVRHILIKTIIILMAVLVCLPCSLKRELKQALHIPVSEVKHAEKPNKTVVCQTLVQEENRKTSVSFHKKDIQKYGTCFGPDVYSTLSIRHNIIPLEEIDISAPIPIYILHEQYRI